MKKSKILTIFCICYSVLILIILTWPVFINIKEEIKLLYPKLTNEIVFPIIICSIYVITIPLIFICLFKFKKFIIVRIMSYILLTIAFGYSLFYSLIFMFGNYVYSCTTDFDNYLVIDREGAVLYDVETPLTEFFPKTEDLINYDKQYYYDCHISVDGWNCIFIGLKVNYNDDYLTFKDALITKYDQSMITITGEIVEIEFDDRLEFKIICNDNEQNITYKISSGKTYHNEKCLTYIEENF